MINSKEFIIGKLQGNSKQQFKKNYTATQDIQMFSSVQLLSHVWLFATPWIAACQASLSITNSQSSPKLMCIESVMPSKCTHPTNVKNEGVKVLVTQSCLCDSMDYSPPGSSVHGWTLLCSDVNVLYDEKN